MRSLSGQRIDAARRLFTKPGSPLKELDQISLAQECADPGSSAKSSN
jgi:hypothetical protein